MIYTFALLLQTTVRYVQIWSKFALANFNLSRSLVLTHLPDVAHMFVFKEVWVPC